MNISAREINDYIVNRIHNDWYWYSRSIGENPEIKPNTRKRRSILSGVLHHIEYKGSPVEQAKSTHEAWLKYHEADGWTYGEVKDELSKTHPCMIPYHKLPVHQRYKDKVFIRATFDVLNYLDTFEIANVETVYKNIKKELEAENE